MDADIQQRKFFFMVQPIQRKLLSILTLETNQKKFLTLSLNKNRIMKFFNVLHDSGCFLIFSIKPGAH